MVDTWARLRLINLLQLSHTKVAGTMKAIRLAGLPGNGKSSLVTKKSEVGNLSSGLGVALPKERKSSAIFGFCSWNRFVGDRQVG
jgi:hypothetical protein